MIDPFKHALTGVPRLVAKFPFRLGTTSYIVPDDIAPNVAALAGFVDDVEVVLFESEEISNLPDEKVIAELQTVQQTCHMSYTIHFPLDVDLGAADTQLRQKSVTQCKRIAALTAPLSPFAYVLHFPVSAEMKSDAEHSNWYARAYESLAALIADGIPAHEICVETLSYPFEWVYPLVEALDVSVCLDVGHVLLNEYDLDEYYHRYWERTRVIHLHGIHEGKDHCSLAHLPQKKLDELIARLSESRVERVLTMEIFGTENFKSSMRVMAKRLT